MRDVVEHLINLRDRLDSRADRDALAEAINALDAAQRRPGRPNGRRITDPIADLTTHPAAHVGVAQLADYWGKHPVTVANYIRARLLPAKKVGGTYLVSPADALAFERRDIIWRRN